MKTNIGVMDKILRLSAVLIIGALYLVDAISGIWAIALGIIALYLIFTSFTGLSPIYLIFGHSSVEKSPLRNKRG